MALFVKSTKIVWATARCLALFGVLPWTKGGESCSHAGPKHHQPASMVIPPCWASVSSSGKWGGVCLIVFHYPALRGSDSIGSISLLVSNIQSGHKLRWMFLAAHQINYFHPFPLIRPFFQHDAKSVKSQNLRGISKRTPTMASQELCHLPGQKKLAHCPPEIPIPGVHINTISGTNFPDCCYILSLTSNQVTLCPQHQLIN